MFQQGHLVDQPQGERREVISTSLTCGHHKDVLRWIKKQLVDNIGRTDPRLTDTTKPLKDSPLRSVLHPVGYLILDRGWIRELKVLPTQIKEVSKVFKLMWNFLHNVELFANHTVNLFIAEWKKVYKFTKR